MPRKNLRENTEQHKPKNGKSKQDDKQIYIAMEKVKNYIETRFKDKFAEFGYEIIFDKVISVDFMIHNIKEKKVRAEFDTSFIDRKIIPDGGVLFLLKKGDPSYKKVVLVSEIKRQGTNDERKEEGKDVQATGNAIERLGKNLTGIKAMMNHEDITPFVCFGWGCDFAPDEMTVLSKLNTLNEFYYLNRTYVFKKDGNTNYNSFSPVSMYFREEPWTIDEMYKTMIEIAETSIRYYIF